MQKKNFGSENTFGPKPSGRKKSTNPFHICACSKQAMLGTSTSSCKSSTKKNSWLWLWGDLKSVVARKHQNGANNCPGKKNLYAENLMLFPGIRISFRYLSNCVTMEKHQMLKVFSTLFVRQQQEFFATQTRPMPSFYHPNSTDL